MRFLRVSFGLSCFLVVAGCSSNESDAQNSDVDSGAGATGGAGSGGSATGTGGTGVSDAGDGAATGGAGGGGGSGTAGAAGTGGACSEFPELERACWDDSWCTIVFHQLDCCGSRLATGIFHTALESFEAAEQLCVSQYPACGCAPGPTQTDSGETTTDEAAIAIQCRSGICTTYLP